MSNRLQTRLRAAILGGALALLMPLLTLGAYAQGGEKILRVHHFYYPSVLDPQKLGYTNEIDVAALVYEGLTRLDTNQETIPAAAESWEYSDDATQITFHLRDGLTYSDGSPLTAENFRYAIERTCDPATAGSYQSILFVVVGCAEFAGLSTDAEGNAREYTAEEHEAAKAALGVRTRDELTLQIDFTQPTPYFHSIAYTWVLHPVKAEIVAQNPEDWWRSPENHIGNGPFTITGIDPDQRLTFAANDRYRLGRPKLDGIEYVYVADPAVALAAYEAGDLDLVGPTSDQLAAIEESDPELAAQLLEYAVAGTVQLGMSLLKAPFDDVKVREAFAYAFDRETWCTEVISCMPTLSWIPPGVPGAIETDKFTFDPEAAVRALAESSYGSPQNLPEITLTYFGDDPTETERAEWVAGQYRDILGIELMLEPLDSATIYTLNADPATHLQLFMWDGWVQDYPDPQNWLSVVWTCDAAYARAIGYCNEEFDRLVALGDSTVDPAERITYYEQAGHILVDDVPGPFAFNYLGRMLVKPNVTGITPMASEGEWPGFLASIMAIDKSG